jgi:hypothetical protein
MRRHTLAPIAMACPPPCQMPYARRRRRSLTVACRGTREGRGQRLGYLRTALADPAMRNSQHRQPGWPPLFIAFALPAVVGTAT